MRASHVFLHHCPRQCPTNEISITQFGEDVQLTGMRLCDTICLIDKLLSSSPTPHVESEIMASHPTSTISGLSITARILRGLSDLPVRGGLREFWSEALRWLMAEFDAIGSSLLFADTPPLRLRQGELPEAIAQAIEGWEAPIYALLSGEPAAEEQPPAPPTELQCWQGAEGEAICLPLTHASYPLGSLSLAFHSGKLPSPEEQELLTALAATMVKLARLSSDVLLSQHRLERLSHLYQVGQALASTLDMRQVLEQTTELAATMLRAEASTLMLVDEETNELVFEIPHGEAKQVLSQYRLPMGQGVAGWVATHGEPALINDTSRDPRFTNQVDAATGFTTKSILCVPLAVKGRIIGVLEVINKRGGENFEQDDLEWLSTLSTQAAIAIENARLYTDLREERDRIIKVEEEVRHELARNLHDGAAQIMAAMIRNIDVARRLLSMRPEVMLSELDFLQDLARQANREVRRLLFELRPVILETGGLVAALEAYVEQLSRGHESFQVHLRSVSLPPLDTGKAEAIFAIVQEAVNNVRKHAQAQNVWLQLSIEGDELCVRVEDDGIGMDVARVEATYDERGSFGLLNMRERARLLDGQLTITSPRPGADNGTCVCLRAPLARLAGERQRSSPL